MRSLTLAILLAVFAISASSQPRFDRVRKTFVSTLDSVVQVEENPYFDLYDPSSFFGSSDAQRKLDVYDVDQNLLNAAVFFAVNNWRKNKRREPLDRSAELFHIARHYHEYYGRYRFRKNTRNRRRVQRVLKKATRKVEFPCGILRANVSTPYAVDFVRGKFHYDRNDEDTSLRLYYGKAPGIGDTTKTPEPVKPLTYGEFARKVVKSWGNSIEGRNMKSRAFRYAACHVVVEEKTLNRKRIPKVNAMIIFGGYLVQEIEIPEFLSTIDVD